MNTETNIPEPHRPEDDDAHQQPIAEVVENPQQALENGSVDESTPLEQSDEPPIEHADDATNRRLKRIAIGAASLALVTMAYNNLSSDAEQPVNSMHTQEKLEYELTNAIDDPQVTKVELLPDADNNPDTNRLAVTLNLDRDPVIEHDKVMPSFAYDRPIAVLRAADEPLNSQTQRVGRQMNSSTDGVTTGDEVVLTTGFSTEAVEHMGGAASIDLYSTTKAAPADHDDTALLYRGRQYAGTVNLSTDGQGLHVELAQPNPDISQAEAAFVRRIQQPE